MAAISHAAVSVSLSRRLISNISININFTMGFCKLHLGSRDIEVIELGILVGISNLLMLL